MSLLFLSKAKIEQRPGTERSTILYKIFHNNGKLILYQEQNGVFVKKRLITLQKAKMASISLVVLYQQLSTSVMIILYVLCIIFFANMDNFILSIFSLL